MSELSKGNSDIAGVRPSEVIGIILLLITGAPQLMDVQPAFLTPVPVSLYALRMASGVLWFFTCGLWMLVAPAAPAALFVIGLVLMRWSCSIAATLVRGAVGITALASLVFFVEYREFSIQYQGESHWRFLLLMNLGVGFIALFSALSTYWYETVARVRFTHFTLCFWLGYCAFPWMGDFDSALRTL